MDSIRVRGARTHNLKNVSLELPRNRLVVITGLSGSGKSSLAFDTLYAEGQRRYVESLSAYARQFLQLMEKPDVDLIEGLSPAIAIEQRSASHNPRSTVGTVTEIHDYLRLLFARVGEPHCPTHHVPLSAKTVSQMVDAVLALPEDTRVMILAPVIVERKGEQLDVFDDLRAQGFIRVRVDGEVIELDPPPPLAKNRKHTIEVVVDRLKVRAEVKQRLAESFETSLRLSGGRAIVVELDTGPRASVFVALRVPDVRLHARRTRTAAVLVQQSDGRVSAMRRPGPGELLRPEARGRLSAPVARLRRREGLGPPQPVLLPDAGEPRRARRLRHRDAVRAADAEGAGTHPAGLGPRQGQVPLRRRTRPAPRPRASVRRHRPQHRAALARDRFLGGEGGTRGLHDHRAVSGLRRHAPAARGAQRVRGRTIDP